MNGVSLEELLKLSFSRESAAMYTAIPCRIINIPDSLEDLRVDVQPLINTLYSDGISEEHSEILGVPVVFPSGRTSMISFPLFVGDTVLCVFSQQSLDNFKSGNGSPTIASDFRRMDARDAIAIPGLTPFGKSLNKPAMRSWPHSTQDVVVSHNIALGTEVEIRLKPDGRLIINTNQGVEVNCATADVVASVSTSVTTPLLTVDADQTTWTGDITLLGNILHTGNYVQTGSYTLTGTATLNGIAFDTHKHTGVQTGIGVSGGPTA